MKKFFSLVLALVMALSLTTVAWGADPVVATVDGTDYTDLQEAIKAAAPSGTVEILKDVTVNQWNMFTQNPTGAIPLITLNMDGLTINGNGHTLTVNSVESLNNGNHLFHNAKKLNINNLTINAPSGSGGISLQSGTIDKVTFNGGTYGIFPGTDEVTIKNCVFNTTSTAIYFDADRDNLVVTNNEFNVPASAVASFVRGDMTFTDNKVNSGYAVSIVSTTADVSGNTFNTPVEVWASNMTLSGNSFTENGKIVIEDPNVTNVDVSGNYWGGGAPTAAQLGGAVADTYINATGGLTGTASAPASAAKDAYYTEDMTALSVYPYCDLANYNYTLEPYTVAADAAKTFAKVAIWQTHKVTGAKTIVYTAVVTSADSANLAFVNGASITYLNTNVSTWTATATAVATVDAADAENCGDVFAAGDVGVYTDANGKVYVEDITGAAYNVNGQLVMLKAATKAYPVVDSAALATAKATPAAGTVYTVKHDYDVDVKTVNSDKTVTRVFCTECKANFAFVEGTVEDAIKKFGAGNYTLETIDGMPVYVALAGYNAGGSVVIPSTGKVESAATFDAGIAMYVGMSVLAATGSAVVIGKKKD